LRKGPCKFLQRDIDPAFGPNPDHLYLGSKIYTSGPGGNLVFLNQLYGAIIKGEYVLAYRSKAKAKKEIRNLAEELPMPGCQVEAVAEEFWDGPCHLNAPETLWVIKVTADDGRVTYWKDRRFWRG
jgi:hypothetical protein